MALKNCSGLVTPYRVLLFAGGLTFLNGEHNMHQLGRFFVRWSFPPADSQSVRSGFQTSSKPASWKFLVLVVAKRVTP